MLLIYHQYYGHRSGLHTCVVSAQMEDRICKLSTEAEFWDALLFRANDNAIKIRLWCCMISNLLMMVMFSCVKRSREEITFSGIVSFVRLNVGLCRYHKVNGMSCSGVNKNVEERKAIGDEKNAI